MTAAQQRKVQRGVHLVGAVVLLAYVYAPLESQLQDVVRFVVFPVLIVTGMAMWQAPRIRRARAAMRSRLTSVRSRDPGSRPSARPS
jgi:hypothetical protein